MKRLETLQERPTRDADNRGAHAAGKAAQTGPAQHRVVTNLPSVKEAVRVKQSKATSNETRSDARLHRKQAEGLTCTELH